MMQCKIRVSALLQHWKYCSLVLNHRFTVVMNNNSVHKLPLKIPLIHDKHLANVVTNIYSSEQPAVLCCMDSLRQPAVPSCMDCPLYGPVGLHRSHLTGPADKPTPSGTDAWYLAGFYIKIARWQSENSHCQVISFLHNTACHLAAIAGATLLGPVSI